MFMQSSDGVSAKADGVHIVIIIIYRFADCTAS